jgi:hypothetical protein
MSNENSTSRTEFMRKSRFESLRSKFRDINTEANSIINSANNDDILKLSLTFNSPVRVVEAEVFDESKFIELAF